MIALKLFTELDNKRHFVEEQLYTNRKGLQVLYDLNQTHFVRWVNLWRNHGWFYVYAVERASEEKVLETGLITPERQFYEINYSPTYSHDVSPQWSLSQRQLTPATRPP